MLLSLEEKMFVLKVAFSFARYSVQVNYSLPHCMTVQADRSFMVSPEDTFRSRRLQLAVLWQ